MPCRTAVRVLAIALLALAVPRSARAQAAPVPPVAAPTAPSAPSAPAGGAAPAEDDLFLQTLPLDIASADYYALVAWARSLGLPETGSADELRKRLYAHYGVEEPPAPAAASRTITVESADRTEYVSAKADSEATVRFSGRVSIVIKDDGSGETITLQADEVLLNRDASILSARGDVNFERKRRDATDYFMGELLELDLDDQGGIFLDGRSERGTGQDALTFRADDIVSKGAGVLVFKDGVISSCAEEDPHYSIRASKIWILGGNEWALLNATLSVGEVPVLYLPFFYYPGEEIVFHPVFGYRAREGRFVQTTTYLLGEKARKKEDISLFRLSQDEGSQRREVRGLFLRSTGEAAPAASSDFVKVMADLYTGLGAFAGAKAQLAALGPFNTIGLSLGLGFSRSLFPLADGSYSPFGEAGGYESLWHDSWILGADLPVRYAFELSTRFAWKSLGLTVALPFYSDPFFEQDFMNRSEDMAWLKFLKQAEEASPPGKRSSFIDRLEAQLSVPSGSLPPWLSSLSVSKLASNLSWAAKAMTPIPAADPEKARYYADPSREFFYPDQLTVIDGALSLAGTLFRYPAPRAKAPAPAKAGAPAGSEWPLPEAVAPWSDGASPDAAGTRPSTAVVPDAAGLPIAGFVPPQLAVAPKAGDPKPAYLSLDWQLSPSVRWDTKFLGASWHAPQDIDWESLYELRALRAAGSLSLAAEAAGGALGLRLGLSGVSQRQDRLNASDDPAYVSPTLAASWALQDAQYRNDRLGASLQLKASPFLSSWLWSPTAFSYALDANLYEYAFASMGAGNVPEYETRTLEWSAERIKAHSLSLSLGARPGGLSQTLSLQASLPPLRDSYAGRLDLRAPFGSLYASARLARPAEGSDLAWEPLSMGLSLGLAPWPTLGATFIWNLENAYANSLSTRLAWNEFSAELNFRRAVPLELVVGTGWQPAGPEGFRATDASLSYRREWKPEPVWKGRVGWTLGLGANARQSFVRFTDSSLDFNLSFTFKVHEFLDIQFAAASRNSSLWRYFPNAFDLPAGLDIEPVNPLLDLLKSFNVFDPDGSDRLESLFKLKSVSVKAIHYLHDWNLSMELAVRPILDQDTLAYDFRTSLTVLLAWKSVPEIKSSYKVDGDAETWD